MRASAAEPALLTFRFPPQSIIERAYFEVASGSAPPFNPPPSNPPLPPPPPAPAATEQPDQPGSVDVRMSGESRAGVPGARTLCLVSRTRSKGYWTGAS